jgi:hypothetical protein
VLPTDEAKIALPSLSLFFFIFIFIIYLFFFFSLLKSISGLDDIQDIYCILNLSNELDAQMSLLGVECIGASKCPVPPIFFITIQITMLFNQALQFPFTYLP